MLKSFWRLLFITAIISAVLKGSSGKEHYFRVADKLFCLQSSRVNWYEANQRCRAMKGDLLTIENSFERNSVTDAIKEIYPWSGFYWTGVNNLADESDFYSSKTNSPITYKFWMPNKSQDPFSTKRCVALEKKGGIFYMSLQDCHKRIGYICDLTVGQGFDLKNRQVIEIRTDLIPVSKLDQFIKIGSKFYYINTEEMTWWKAKYTCRVMNTNLATIEKEDKKYLLDFWLRKFSEVDFWVDGYDYENTPKRFIWSSTKKEIGPFWQSGQPTDEKSNDCVLLTRGSSDYRLKNLPCSTKLGFICESRIPHNDASHDIIYRLAPPIPREGKNYKIIGNRMYYISYEQRNYFDAQRFCRNLNMYLFAFDSEGQYIALNNHFARYERPEFAWWTGYNDFATQYIGEFSWQETFLPFFYSYQEVVDFQIRSCIAVKNYSPPPEFALRMSNRIACNIKLNFACGDYDDLFNLE